MAEIEIGALNVSIAASKATGSSPKSTVWLFGETPASLTGELGRKLGINT
jgi:hypothetical protein